MLKDQSSDLFAVAELQRGCHRGRVVHGRIFHPGTAWDLLRGLGPGARAFAMPVALKISRTVLMAHPGAMRIGAQATLHGFSTCV